MLIYKIFRSGEWAWLEGAGETEGASVDIALERAEEMRSSFTPLVSAASGNRHTRVTLSAGLAVYLVRQLRKGGKRA